MLKTILTYLPWYSYIIIFVLFVLARIVPYFIRLKCSDLKTNVTGYIPVEGVIYDYEIKTTIKHVKDNKNQYQEIEMKSYYPKIQYQVDEGFFDFTYKKEYNINYEPDKLNEVVTIYIDPKHPNIAKGLFTDIYATELKSAAKANVILSIMVFILCTGLTIANIMLK